MGNLFETILYEPLFNALIFLYDVLPGQDIGIAIILLTLAIKIVLLWPSQSAIRAQKQLQEVQPKLSEIQKKYKDNREELGRKMMEFYKENKVNPLSSCLPLLVQLPVLWALYRVFFNGLQTVDGGLLAPEQLAHLYGSLQITYQTQAIDPTFLGFVNLADHGNVVLALIAGGFQFWQAWMLSRRRAAVKGPGTGDENMAVAMNKQMTYVFPIITVIFAYQFPAGLALYWVVSTMFTIAQQWFVFHRRSATPSSPPASPSAPDSGIIEGVSKTTNV